MGCVIMAWRNYKNSTIVCFKSRGKGQNLSLGGQYTFNSNSTTTISIDSGIVNKQRFSLKSDSKTAIITFYNGANPVQKYNLNGNEVHTTIMENMINNSNSLIVNVSELVSGEEIILEVYPYYLKIDDKNFVEKQEGVASSLNQLLSVIKSEIWYNISYGLPLYDKISTKFQIDAVILSIVNGHPEVITVDEFNSYLSGNSYHCDLTVESIYGQLKIGM